MPRDVNGDYTLPAGNPVVPNTIIETLWANTTLDDIAAALTDSLSRSGDGGMLVSFQFADGTAGAPGMSWVNAPTSGWYRAGTGDFRYSIAGADVLKLLSNQVLVPSGAEATPGLAFIAENGSGLYRAGAGDIRFAIGGSDVLAITSDGLDIVGSLSLDGPLLLDNGTETAPAYSFSGEDDTGWYLAAAGAIRLAIQGTDILQYDLTEGFTMLNASGTPRFTQSPNGVMEWFPPAINNDPILSIFGGNFQIAANGTVLGNTIIKCGDVGYSTGGVALVVGNATDTGYVDWRLPDDTRSGYAGAAEAGGPILFVAEDSSGFAFCGDPGSKQHTFSPQLDATPKGSCVVSINMPDAVSWNGLAVDNEGAGGGSAAAAVFQWGGATVGTIGFSAGGTVYNTTSDKRLKEDIEELVDDKDFMESLEPVRFKWKDTKKASVGFLAQDVYQIAPEAVTRPDSKNDYWLMDYSRLLPYVVAELRSLRKRLAKLETP